MAAERLAEDAAWAGLTGELDRWAEAGRAATLWWRDDDAAELTPALERLLDLSAGSGVPLALAVIPGQMSPELPARLAGSEGVSVLQHGWRHVNHARPGEGGWELGDHRPLEQVSEDLASGHRRLADAFGARFLPVLVPPWNRISARVTERLPALGFLGFSTFGARAREERRSPASSRSTPTATRSSGSRVAGSPAPRARSTIWSAISRRGAKARPTPPSRPAS